MTTIVTSVAAKLAEYLMDPIIREARYLFCVNKIIRDLETQKNELLITQESVQKRVKEALSKTHEIEDAVKKWQDAVKDLITEVEKLQQDLMGIEGCFGGWCPTLKRYRLCKQLAEKTTAMTKLNETSEFNPFSHPAPIPDIEYFSSRDFMLFESTKLAFDEIMEALRDDNCYRIGLRGMGGSGKTALAKELGKKAKESKIFDHVAFTTVSQTPNVRKIQGEIADLLRMKLDEESEAGRARRIALRLRSKERTLVILDDVWAVLNLEDIGIPSNGNDNNCKVLLTTRHQQVCDSMICRENQIQLRLLSQDESWILFQHHANVNDATHLVAQEISMECKGLPIAIVAVGRAVEGAVGRGGIGEMNAVLQKLRASKPIDVVPGERDAFSCLQLSYDYLRNEEDKLLFLICAMFPEDHDISREDLFRYGKGLGLYREEGSFEMARNQVNVHIKNLIDSCLLTHSEDRDDYFKMHDMVRDVALWIGSKQDHNISVNPTIELNALIEDMQAVCSWYGQVDHFSHQHDASKLKILVPNLDDELNLSFALFEDIQVQKVVAIKSRYVRQKLSMIESTQWLANLQTLRLVELKLDDISFVASLRSLEILDLRGSTFNELPDGIKELSKLKLLDLSKCNIEEPCRAIERCSQLQELYALSYRGNIEVPWESLNTATFPKLEEYQMQVGPFPNYFAAKALSSKCLYLGGFSFSTLGAAVNDLLQRATQVCFYDLRAGYKNMFPKMDEAVGGMNALSNLELTECKEIECLLSTDSSHASSSGGHHLLISVRPKLCNLKCLEISYCPKLTKLFPMSVAQTLVQLQKLKIYDCEELRHIIINEEEKLFEIDSSFMLFQQLKELIVSGCDKLKCIFPVSCSNGFSQLQMMNIGRASGLKYVFGMSNCAFSCGCNFGSLKNLSIIACPLLTSLFPVSVAQTLLLLEDLYIAECSELKHIVVNEGGDSLKFPQLERLCLRTCPKLQYVIPVSSVQSLIKLKEIKIQDVSALEYIFVQDDCKNRSTNENEIQVVFPLLEVFYLQDAPNLLQILPENFCSRFPEERLSLLYCPKLTTFDFNTVAGSELRLRHSNSALQEYHSNQETVVDISHCGVANIVNVRRIGLDEDQQQLIALKFERLYLKNLREMRFIWTARKQIFSLQFLKELELNQCGKLECIFNSAVHMSMPFLAELIISECEELKGIFEGVENFHSPSLGLPKLEKLEVKRCNKLRTIFSASMAMTLSQLEILHISEAAQLEEVVRCEGEDIADDQRKIMLPKLKKIELKKLPNLIEVWHGLNLHEIKLEKRIIDECPKFVPI